MSFRNYISVRLDFYFFKLQINNTFKKKKTPRVKFPTRKFYKKISSEITSDSICGFGSSSDQTHSNFKKNRFKVDFE